MAERRRRSGGQRVASRSRLSQPVEQLGAEQHAQQFRVEPLRLGPAEQLLGQQQLLVRPAQLVASRVLPVVGFIGAALLLASDAAVLFGAWERISAPSGLLAIPIALWEFSLGVYLIVKGFKPSPITAATDAASRPPAYRDPTV